MLLMIYPKFQFNSYTLYFNAKKITRLAKVSTIKGLEISDGKVVDVSGSNSKLLYC